VNAPGSRPATTDWALRSLEDLDRARRAALSRAAAAPSPTTSTREAGTELETTGGAADRESELAEVLQDGAAALERLAAGEAPVDRREVVGLEAIVQLEGRPAIRIHGGHFDPPPEQWRHLDGQRGAIEQVIAAVGRVQATPAPSDRWLATAFAVAPGVVMTNRHVAEAVASSDDDVTWRFSAGIEVSLDFVAERPEPGPGQRVVEVLGVHEEYDLALLRTDEDRDGPRPLMLAGAEPAGLDGGDVYVIGHPVQDGARNDPVEMVRIFEGVFHVKRLQPGKAAGLRVHGQREVLGHDCSTLGGNSGSCVVDLATGRVAGLHFRGDWQEINHAVPLWRLAEDPLLVRHGVAFA
jgi:hypothetical protein